MAGKNKADMIFPLNGREFNGDQSHGIESAKKSPTKQTIVHSVIYPPEK